MYSIGVHVLTVNTEFMWRGLETVERFAFLPIYKARTIFFYFPTIYVYCICTIHFYSQVINIVCSVNILLINK